MPILSRREVSKWFVIETLSPTPVYEPRLVFEDGATREFKAIHRRRTLPTSAVTKKIKQVVETVRASGRENAGHTLLDSGQKLHFFAAPSLGPGNVVFAVQLLITSRDNADIFLDGRRKVGCFVYDPQSKNTFHGPTMETEIMGLPQTSSGATRASAEIFSLFEKFQKLDELSVFTNRIGNGTSPEGDNFSSLMEMKGVDGRRRSTFMSFRPHAEADGLIMRGLVHDITDVQKPENAEADFSSLALARTAFAMASPPASYGFGQLDLRNCVVLQWLQDPPPPLDLWTTSVPQYKGLDADTFEEQAHRILTRAASETTFTIHVRFRDADTWTPTEVHMRPVGTGESSQAIVRVTALTNER